MGARHALAATSGTAALTAALKALGVGGGDAGITQSYTFVATVEAIAACGGVPVVTTLTMEPGDLAGKITGKTKAIIPVHPMDVAARMDEIAEIASKQTIPVLEDDAQACGGSYRGEIFGTNGDVGCVIFDFERVITTGEGGVLSTDDDEIVTQVRAYANHGRVKTRMPRRVSTPGGSRASTSGGVNFGSGGARTTTAEMDTVIRRQRKAKQQIQDGLSDLEWIEFRRSPDPRDDTGSTIAFFFLESRRRLRHLPGAGDNGNVQ